MRRLLAISIAVLSIASLTCAQGTNGRSTLTIDEPSATPSSLEYSISAPKSPDATPVQLFMSWQAGQTPLSQMGMSFVLPLSGPVMPLSAAQVKGGRATGRATIPTLPAGVTVSDLWFAGVVFDPMHQALVTAAIPFGPIIEDAIQ